MPTGKHLSGMKVANAPCSFGVMAGFQPDPPLTHLDVLDQIAEAGFAGTELGDWGFMPEHADALGPDLLARGLAMVGAFTPVELTDHGNLDASTDIALRAATLLAAVRSEESTPGPFVILAADTSRHPERPRIAGRVTPADAISSEAFKALAGGAEHIARAIRDETGLPTVFHPHCATPVETMAETVRLADMTDPSVVGLCFDTGHVAYAGDDLDEWLSTFAGRTRLVHFKDMDAGTASDSREQGRDYAAAVRKGLFCPLGEGSVDFQTSLNRLASAGYEGWIVVEDEIPPGRVPPLEAAKRDRAFLGRLGL
jgi:inosose dehydratase